VAPNDVVELATRMLSISGARFMFSPTDEPGRGFALVKFNPQYALEKSDPWVPVGRITGRDLTRVLVEARDVESAAQTLITACMNRRLDAASPVPQSKAEIHAIVAEQLAGMEARILAALQGKPAQAAAQAPLAAVAAPVEEMVYPERGMDLETDFDDLAAAPAQAPMPAPKKKWSKDDKFDWREKAAERQRTQPKKSFDDNEVMDVLNYCADNGIKVRRTPRGNKIPKTFVEEMREQKRRDGIAPLPPMLTPAQ